MKLNHEDPKYSLIVSPEAKDDIDDILQYTISEWSQNQVEKYKNILGKGFATLKDTPFLAMSLN
ncbi:MAG: type II toxin-antitoxin system RelE/ParE family toxin [Candidatus Anammoxibacter sp.]